jgi:tetratricopeptide (TPR) repeat protein
VNFDRIEPILQSLDDDWFYATRRGRIAWHGFALIVLGALVYVRAVLRNGLFWQDQSTLNSLESVFSLTHLWTVAPDGLYRPLSMAILWVEGRGFGNLAVPYHCVSFIAHAASSVLLWLVLRRLAIPGAWLAAALFALHPVQVESIAWIVQQPHVIGAFIYLLALWLGLRSFRVHPPLPEDLEGTEPEDAPSAVGYAAALVACVAAVLSDPLGLSLPLVLAVLVWWKRRLLPRAEQVRLAGFFGIALIGIAAGIFLRWPGAAFLDVAPTLSFAQRVLVAGRAIVIYAISPLRLYSSQFIHSRWYPAWDAWNAWPILLVAAMGIVAWAGRGRWGLVPIVCPLLFLLLLLPGLGTSLSEVAPVTYIADHENYLAIAVPLTLASAGLFAVAARLSSSMNLRTARAIVGIIAIALLGVFAAIQSLTYRDTDAAFKAALSHDPDNSVARGQYAILLLQEDPTRSLNVLSEAGPTVTTDLALLNAQARVCLALGDNNGAISNYRLAQRLAPEHPAVRLGLADSYDAAGVQAIAEGRREDAVENYNNALAVYDAARQLNFREDLIDDGIGEVLLHEGRLAESIDQFDAALTSNPACVPARVHKALALFDSGMQGDADGMGAAMSELREALRVDPADPEAFCAAGDMQFRLKNVGGAEKDYRAAIHYQPGSARAWTGLGFSQSMQGRFQEAVRSFERALTLRANAPDAVRGKQMAQAQLSMGNQKS